MNEEPLSESGSFASLLRAAARVPDAQTGVPPLHAGDVLGGRFLVEGRLGSGGMGIVYRARDLERRTPIALKTLRRSDAAGLLRFKQEFRSFADVVHPNLVLLDELVRDGDFWFFTMELVEGAPFGEDAPLRPAFAQLARAVNAIHASGHVHNDLKPSNVLVTRDGRVVVLDFGLVGDADGPYAGRHQSGVGGTPAYMAPEQTAGRSAGPATDWFAAGVMLFQRLTGRLPWDGPPETMLLRRSERAPRPSAWSADVPPDLDELCFCMLAPDPRERPSGAAIQEVLDAPGEAGERPHVVTSVRPAPFVGRQNELAALRGAFDELTARPRIVQLRGPSGIGKSALARRFLELLTADGHLVMTGRCHSRESVPFAALDAVVDRLASEGGDLAAAALGLDESAAVRRAFPVLGLEEESPWAADPAEPDDPLRLRRLAASGLRRIIASVAAGRRVAIWIDDFQWADADSASLLGEMLASAEAPPVLLLLTTRNTPSSRLLDEVAAAGRVACETMDLGPLSAQAALDLASALLPAGERARAGEIAAEASGHPFFLELLARPDVESLREDAHPSSLDSAIRLRIDHLPPEQRQVLTAVAVAGHPVSEGVLRGATRLPSDAPAVRALCATSFLRVATGQRIEPYHDRIRDVVYEGLAEAERASWHGELATALEADGAEAPELLAHHFLLAGAFSSARAYAIEGAQRAHRGLAFDRAAELFALARRISPPDDPQARPLARRHAEALEHARRSVEAGDVYLELAASAPEPAEGAELEQRAAVSYFVGGHVERGIAVLEPLLARAGVDVPREGDALRQRIAAGTMRLVARGFGFQPRDAAAVDRSVLARIDLLRAAADAWSSLDPPRATAFLLEGAPLALDSGERQRVLWAFCQVGLFLASLANEGLQAQGAALLSAAGPMADQLGVSAMRALVELGRARAALSVGRFRQGVRSAERSLAYAATTEVSQQVVQVAETSRLYGLLACGDLLRVSELLPILQSDARRRNDAYLLVTVRLYAAHLRLLAEGDADGAIALIDAAVIEWGEKRVLFQSWLALRTRICSELYAERVDRAAALLEEAWPALEASGLLGLGVVRPHGWRLRALVELHRGGPATAERVRAWAETLSEDRPDERAVRLTLQAELHLRDGQREPALEAMRRARTAHRLAGQRLDAAVADVAWRLWRGADVGPALARLHRLGVGDPWAWVVASVPAIRRGGG